MSEGAVPEYEVVASALRDIEGEVKRFEQTQKRYAKLHKAVVDANSGASEPQITPKQLNDLTRM